MLFSLMLFAGRAEDDERSMLEEFVAPMVLPGDRDATPSCGANSMSAEPFAESGLTSG